MTALESFGRSCALIAMLATAACLEPRHVASPSATRSSEMGIVLSLSDTAPPAGTTVDVVVQLVGSPGATARVASYTARVQYDTAALRFEGELQLDAQTTRAINPAARTIRVAGFALNGIPDNRLFALTFRTRDDRGASALRSLEVLFSELHTAEHEDLRPRVRAAGVIWSGGR